MNNKKKVIPILVTFFLVFLDQVSKYFIRTSGGFYICNAGIAWGLQIPKTIIFLLIITAVLFLFYFLSKQFKNSSNKTNKLLYISLILILSGALSNLSDRFFFGCVIDFIKIPFWPFFNIADICISTGTMLIILNSFYNKR